MLWLSVYLVDGALYDGDETGKDGVQREEHVVSLQSHGVNECWLSRELEEEEALYNNDRRDKTLYNNDRKDKTLYNNDRKDKTLYNNDRLKGNFVQCRLRQEILKNKDLMEENII